MVITQAAQVQGALDALGIGQDIIVEAVKRGEAVRNSATAHHPPSWSGFACWAETTRALRDLGVPKGCKKDDARNFSRLVVPSGEHAIAVTTGDIFTGDPNNEPQPKYPKGAAAQYAVQQAQLTLSIFEAVEASKKKAGPKFWFLLVRREKAQVIVELAQPIAITTDGAVSRWEERIILGAINVDPTPNIENEPEYADDVDVAVTLRT